MANILEIKEFLFYDGNDYVKVIRATISLDNPIKSATFGASSLLVQSPEIEKASFYSGISRNGKDVYGLFTSDAFSSVINPVNIIAYENETPITSFENVDFNTITPLQGFLANATFLDGNEAWLANFYS